MKRIIVIEFRGGVFNEMNTISNPIDSKTLFNLIDNLVTVYAERYDVPIEKIEVNIFMKYSKT